MAIFIDSSDLSEIEKFSRLGIISGVTTNPTIMYNEGVSGGLRGIRAQAIKIAKLVDPIPVSVELLSNDYNKMVEEAKDVASWAVNINVKVPVHGPEGELHNLEVINLLETKYDVRVNATAMMSAQQCYLTALAGATYVSIFGGRINNMGYNCSEEIRKTRQLIDSFGLKARIIVGSTREVLNIVEWLLAGAHIVTATPKLIEAMIVHPYSKETVQMFLRDANNIMESKVS